MLMRLGPATAMLTLQMMHIDIDKDALTNLTGDGEGNGLSPFIGMTDR